MKYLQILILSGVYCVLLLLSHTVLGEQDTSLNNRIDSLKSSVEVDTSQSLNVNADSLANNKNNIDTSTNYIISTIDDSSEQADHNILKKVKVHFTQNELVSTYFTYSSWSSRSLLFIICILYFYWLYRLNKKISIDNKDKMDKHDIGSNSIWQQALKAIILFLILLPFASLKIPVLVIQSSYLLITLLLLILLFAHITLSERKNLIAIFIFYILLLLSNLLISTEVMPRIFAGFMNILGISLLLRLNKILISKIDDNKHFKYVAWGIILTHTLALICILFGYIDYARIWSTVAGVSLVQTIALKYLKTIFARDLELQFTSAPRLHTLNNFSLDKVLHVFYKLLKLCFVALVFITFFNILGVIGEVIVFVKNIFNNEHHIGNITYNYADLLLAIFVLWLSNWFQKNLKNVLDDSPKKSRQVTQMTLFPLLRLSIIIVGFLLAINILGLGLDKLTVIIGALSVGIGLGLQNIINNFVSGVILVFEKPFKIGDYIEIADKRGQVLEIGIRSSTLMTDQGAKVIIPNGDLLSGRLVNWTFSKSDIRVNFDLVVSNNGNIEEIKKYIRTTISEQKYVDKFVPIRVNTKDITNTGYRLAVQVGINNVKYIEIFKSQFLEEIMSHMNDKGITISSV